MQSCSLKLGYIEHTHTHSHNSWIPLGGVVNSFNAICEMPKSVQWDSNPDIVKAIEVVEMVVMPTILAWSCSCAWEPNHVERPTYMDPNCNFV